MASSKEENTAENNQKKDDQSVLHSKKDDQSVLHSDLNTPLLNTQLVESKLGNITLHHTEETIT